MFGDIRNQLGERLDYSFNLGSLSNRYLLVIPHSSDNLFKINLYSYLAEQVIQEGLSTLSFSFAGSGNSQGLIANSTLQKKFQIFKMSYVLHLKMVGDLFLLDMVWTARSECLQVFCLRI